ncbi:MAG TPA: hypothetical protein VFS10_05470 [Pyrinomonadaceae bacterium]|nr:hypothetical protein [Pyrinomonadaceae bacterium]
MPTPAQIRNTVETRMRALISDLLQRQRVYQAMTGRLWQGARTHAVLPKDGTATAPDLTRKADGEDDWQTFGAQLPAALECAFEVGVYDGPAGEGFTVTATVEVAGQVWQRTANVGPEKQRASGWYRVESGVGA